MLKPTHDVHVQREIDAPAQAVWDRVSNHADTHTWVRAARVRVLAPGDPAPNGLGAVREVSFPGKRLWTTIRERVTRFEPPRAFSYTITDGMPGLRDHLGTLTVEPLGPARSRLVWHVDFAFSPWHPMRWFARPFTRTFGRVLDDALAEIARQMQPG
ncbi:MAG TPA: SRPBCC family protein [Kofleriaceae bacterium]|nr:SRPBCC family protein [Kofleriaceae bacterium]